MSAKMAFNGMQDQEYIDEYDHQNAMGGGGYHDQGRERRWSALETSEKIKRFRHHPLDNRRGTRSVQKGFMTLSAAQSVSLPHGRFKGYFEHRKANGDIG